MDGHGPRKSSADRESGLLLGPRVCLARWVRTTPLLVSVLLFSVPCFAGCDGGGGGDGDAGPADDGSITPLDDGGGADTGPAFVCEGTPAECAPIAEAAAAAELETLRAEPSGLYRFLESMPKGGDLHNHLSGAVYAESYLGWAREGSFCISNSSLALSTSCSGAGTSPIPGDEEPLFGDVVRMWSMLDFVPSASMSGRDHFFATFGKFGAISGREHGRMLADVRTTAALENVLYLEPMLTSNSTASGLGQDVWSASHSGGVTAADFATFHAELLAAPGFAAARDRYISDAASSDRDADWELACESTGPRAGCGVEARFQAYISRSGSLPGVFGQMVAAYEAARTEPRLVGLNLVGPEDSSGARGSYDIEMAMLGYLHTYYRESGLSPLRLSLHAGELTAAFVPSTYRLDVEDHIRNAVMVAGAERIGHGVDIEHESDPEGLFTLLRERDVLVEICLASNDLILDVTGAEHPLDAYLGHDVPIAFATDDPGVARSSLTAELFRAVYDQGVDYPVLKRTARASLQYSFLAGESLFTDATYAAVVTVCAPPAGQTLASAEPSAECAAFLEANDRARVQHLLEQRLIEFETAR